MLSDSVNKIISIHTNRKWLLKSIQVIIHFRLNKIYTQEVFTCLFVSKIKLNIVAYITYGMLYSMYGHI